MAKEKNKLRNELYSDQEKFMRKSLDESLPKEKQDEASEMLLLVNKYILICLERNRF